MTGTRAAARLLLISGGLVAGAICVEVGLRVDAAVNPGFRTFMRSWDPEAILIEPLGALGYRQKPLSRYAYRNGTSATSNAMGFRGPTVSIVKPAGVRRIELLGGSTTHGWGVDDSQTIDGYMRDLFTREFPDHPCEVVNLGFDGYDSYQDLNRFMTDGLRLEPDLVIVNSGPNDAYAARFPNLRDHDPRTLIWEADLKRLRAQRANGGPTVLTRLKHYSYLARLPSALRGVRRQRASGPARALETPNLQAADYFESNLRHLADEASAHGVAVLFSTPPSALSLSFAPHDTSTREFWVRDAATTQQVRDTLNARMLALVDSLAAERRVVGYVPHHLVAAMFRDDAHLTPAGNRQMARDFVDSAARLLRLRRN